jgi:hypothetical protein
MGSEHLPTPSSVFSQVLGTLIAKYNYSLSCRLKLVQGLKLFEHMAVSFFLTRVRY